MLIIPEKRFRIEQLYLKAAVTAAIVMVGIVALISDYPCPFLRLTGIPCPGCGTTHAVRALLCGDFLGAFRFHGMFWTFPVLWLYFLTDFRFLKVKRYNDGAFIAIVAGYFLDYCIRVFL